ncbi:MAG: hypothetical protein HC887_02930 [Desulfobacteraceae bacterium]|nr:hypothetical protein [Desulfobacteraceae bacterium]
MKTLAKFLAVAMVASFLIAGSVMATDIGLSSISGEATLQEVLGGNNAESLNTGLDALANQISGGMFWSAGYYDLSMFNSGARSDGGRIGYYEIRKSFKYSLL